MPKHAWTGFAALISLVVLFAAVFSPTAAVAQKEGHFDVSASAGEVFGKQSSGNGTTDDPTNSFAQLGTFRYRRSARHSFLVNYGRSAGSQVYNVAPNQFQVLSKSVEYSGAYALNLFPTAKFQTFVMAGAGTISFSPGNVFASTPLSGDLSYQVPLHLGEQRQFAFLYGGGIDYPVKPHWAIRLQVRGLIYRSPDFGGPGFFTGARAYVAEPMVGLVFRF